MERIRLELETITFPQTTNLIHITLHNPLNPSDSITFRIHPHHTTISRIIHITKHSYGQGIQWLVPVEILHTILHHITNHHVVNLKILSTHIILHTFLHQLTKIIPPVPATPHPHPHLPDPWPHWD